MRESLKKLVWTSFFYTQTGANIVCQTTLLKIEAKFLLSSAENPNCYRLVFSDLTKAVFHLVS